ncbi:MAG: cyanophycinase [Spirochaetales bacterium]|nr:cyanophycinase [Spirochaetales bacterium]
MGPLLIVGGADRIDQPDIYRAFIDNCPGKSSPVVAIIATATSEPEISFGKIRDRLQSVADCRVELLQISRYREEWRDGAFRTEVLSRIEAADGFWFTGGDQSATVASLLKDDGSDTPALEALRRKHIEGAVIGGTSAGAAIMSDPMICGGETSSSLFSLSGVGEWDSAVVLGRGFGFLEGYLVDQHFDMRSRMGRLIAGLNKSPFRRGLGVSENTALLIRDGIFRVYGAGQIYYVDMAGFSAHKGNLRGIKISFYERGDLFVPGRGLLDGSDKLPIGGDSVLSSPGPVASGVFSPYGDLRNFLARLLMDNDESLLESDRDLSSKYVTSYLFDPVLFPGESSFPALELRFHKVAGLTKAYADNNGGFAVEDVVLEMYKKKIEITI